MFRYLKLQFIRVIVLFFFIATSAFGQNETVNFIWKDKQKNDSNGTLALSWYNNSQMGYWELQLRVKWYETGGEDITDPAKMPFIYISDYDIEIHSSNQVNCLNFTVSENIYEIQFQESGELRFDMPPDIENPGTLAIIFRYALSAEDIASANIDPILIPGREKLIIDLPDTRVRDKALEDNKQEISLKQEDNEPSINYIATCKLIREQLSGLNKARGMLNGRLSSDDQSIGLIRNQIDASEPTDTISRGQYETDLQAYLESANEQINNIDSAILQSRDLLAELVSRELPRDSVVAYQGEITGLDNDFRALRREYVQTRMEVRGLLEELGSAFAGAYLNELKKAVERKYGDLFRSHVDSVRKLQEIYASFEPALVEEIRKGPRKASRSEKLSDLRESHEEMKTWLGSLYEEHREKYFLYRDDIEETGTINSLETLHVIFDDIYENTNNRLAIMDLEISRLMASLEDPGFRLVPSNIIIGSSLLIFLIIVIIIARRSGRRAVRQSMASSPTNTAASSSGGFSMLENDLDESVEYYKIMVPPDHQDISLAEIHLHIRVIKAVYHLIQGALIDKKPDDFGGLLFGRQYKADGNGNDKHVIIAEKLVPAVTIRPEMTAERESGALLVDEIEKLVEENKKMVLLGWLTSAKDKALVMPENQAKVHRTFFRDKWQIACLLYPGSELLDSGFFVRRKSGFFDTIPTGGLLHKWDELYQFAVDPPLKKDAEIKKKPDSSEYVKLKLNHNWCDSIVESLFIHPDVIREIAFEKDNRVQLVAGQKANGFLYGVVWVIQGNSNGEDAGASFEVYLNKLTPSSGNENPREIPGHDLLGWLRYDDQEIFELLKQAVPYHEEQFKTPYQVAVLINSMTNEIRFFSRKHSLEMNNNTIETEEFNLDTLLSEAGALKPGK